jgi:hypothetical protein
MGHAVSLTLAESMITAIVIAVPGANREAAVIVADRKFVLQNS